MKKMFCLLFLFFPALCFSQLDSLRKCLAKTNGKERLELLNKLTAQDTSSSFIYYHKEALALAYELHDSQGEVHVWNAMGNHYYNTNQNDSAFFYYSKTGILARKYKLQHELIKSLDMSAATMENEFHYDRAVVLYKQALFESRKTGDKNELAGILENYGIFNQSQRNDSLALDNFNEELKLEGELKDSSAMATCFSNIGIVYCNKGEYANGIDYYKKTLAIEKKLKDTISVAGLLLNIGIVYKDQGIYDWALENLLQSVRYYERSSDLKNLASCYNTIADLEEKIGEKDSALAYNFRSLEIRRKIKNQKGIAGSYTNIGEVYKNMGKYDSALVNLNRSVKIKTELGDKALLASSMDLLGEVYFLKNDYTKAENYYQQSMNFRKELEDPMGKAKTLNHLGALYLAWKKIDIASATLDSARTIATNIGAKSVLRDNYEITISMLREKGDFEKALVFYDKLTALKDILLNDQKNKAIAGLQIKYETEKKEQQIVLMNEKEKSDAAIVSKQNTLIYSLIAGAGLLVIIILISLQAYRTGRKANKQSKIIIEQKQMMIDQKQAVMKELHHRVKNNLQVLSSLLNLQQLRVDDNSTKDALKAVQHRLNAMLLIHQDLYGESVDSQVNMNEYINKLIDNLIFSFGFSDQQLKVNLSADVLSLDADKALCIGFICNEIISNSFKHAFSKTAQPELTITLRKEKENLFFILADNGQGMQIEKDITKTKSFGLKLIDMFIKDLKGNFNIVSNSKGSSFEFIIPVIK